MKNSTYFNFQEQPADTKLKHENSSNLCFKLYRLTSARSVATSCWSTEAVLTTEFLALPSKSSPEMPADSSTVAMDFPSVRERVTARKALTSKPTGKKERSRMRESFGENPLTNKNSRKFDVSLTQ